MKRPEQIVCMVAALLALGSLLGYPRWTARRQATSSGTAPIKVAVAGESRVSPPDIRGPETMPMPPRWLAPSDETGGGRAGDLFTAPPLEHDPATGRLRIRIMDADASSTDVAFGLSLVGIVYEPFRLQLVGYASDPAGLIGVFENRITGRVFLARAPEELPELRLRIESLAIERRRQEVPGSGTVAGRAAVARVLDRRDGTSIELSSARRRTVGRPSARFRDVARGVTYDACPGGEFAVDDVTYRVATIDDQRVQLCRVEAGEPGERRWLQLAAASASP